MAAIINSKHLPLLLIAVAQRDEVLVLICLASDHNVNGRDPLFGRTALHIAVRNNYLRMARILLNHDADVNARTKDNLTPLHIAVSNRSNDMVNLLLEYGANVNPENNFQDKTPLYMAIEYECVEIAWILLHKGASVAKSTIRNTTLLHVATKVGHAAMVRLVLQHMEVDMLSIRDTAQNKTPLELALELCHFDIAESIKRKLQAETKSKYMGKVKSKRKQKMVFLKRKH